MKKYNKILEAVNRGIQLALYDFDDDEIQNVKSKQIIHRDHTKDYLDLMKEVVDLGLPSGTLWCKYNLGVNPNQLFKAEDWYGNYYAWGELEPNKKKYDWDNYKFGNKHDLTKYCNNPEYGLNGFTDNLIKLLPEDDVAYQNKYIGNYKFCIPTIEQFEELLKYTKNYWINNYDPNKIKHNPKDDEGIQGLNGSVFEGKNGNTMFIPAAGYCSNNGRHNLNNNGPVCLGTLCKVWSSSFELDFSDYAQLLRVDYATICGDISKRCDGYSIRPVINL